MKLKEYMNPKTNKDKKTITFVNDADTKKAKNQLGSMNVSVSGKTLKFVNTADFNKAKNVLKIKENNTMKITKRELTEMIKTVIKEETEYQKFFKGKLGDRNLGDMSDEEKKSFFADVDKEWKAKNESIDVEETLEPVSQAAGEPEYNPTQRTKAKKRDQMLAKESKVEQYVRKIIREELKFVMFNEVPGTISRKRAKKRINMTGSTEKML